MRGRLVLAVAGNRWVRSALTSGRAGRSVVSRFVAGEDVEAALRAAAALRGDGLRFTLDSLGEHVQERSQAARTARTYRVLVDRLADAGLAEGAEISVKLSALGQALGADGPQRATGLAAGIVEHATASGVDVTVDMEESATVDSTLDTVRTLRASSPRVGCVLQAMLHRTPDDARELAFPGSRVRLVKGAYAEPAQVAHPRKRDVDRAYARCLRILLEGGAYPMVATHDLRLVRVAERLLDGSGSGSRSGRGSDGEFQMLYGIRAAEQRRLAAAGRTVRVYVPFGTDWYGYFSRRLAERPANVAFLARSLVRR